METLQLELEEQALEWLLQLESDDGSECRQRFLAWCEQSPAHVQAFLEVTALDRQLERIDAEGKVDLEALIRECRGDRPENVVAFGAATAGSSPTPSARRRRVGGRVWALAAALAIAVVAAGVWRVAVAPAPSYVTQVGEQRSIKLSDGSVIYLNTDSRIAERYSEGYRDVDLLQGEAFFVVAPETDRPFRVRTGDATVQAVGTQFNVYRKAGAVTVSVLQGKVRVETDANRVALGAGEAAEVAPGSIIKESRPEVMRATAWRQRQLDFRQTPLAEVAEQFNRYNLTQLVIEDADVAARKMNGVFDADAPEQLIRFLEQDASLQVVHEGRVVRVGSRTGGPQSPGG